MPGRGDHAPGSPREGSGHRLRKRLVIVAVVAALAVGGWVLARSWLFGLEGIDVIGLRSLTRSQVLATSGLRQGMSVLSVDTARVEKKLETLPLVRDATVELVYPSTVRIRIDERNPAALVQAPSGIWLLDADGTLIAQAPNPPPKLPRVAVNALIGSPAMSEALRLWVALPAEQRKLARRIDASRPDSLVVFIEEVRVTFGTPDDLAAKVKAMSSLMSWASQNHRRVVSIDVSVPSRPAAVFA